MKKRKLKRFVLPTVFVLMIVSAFLGITAINNLLISNNRDYDYSKSLLKESTQYVLNEVKEPKFVKPFTSDKVDVKTTYYSKDDDNTKQQNSLILYQNTYMPSTGILYFANEEFDVVSAYDGVIKSIKNDSLLGTVVEVSHNANLTTFYYSLKNVVLKEGEEVKAGTKLGNSSVNEINAENSLLFEVYYQGKSMDPEKLYESNPKDLQ